MDLDLLGWRSSLEPAFQPYRDSRFVPARVAEEHRDRYIVFGESGELVSEITGRLRFTAESRLDLPAVGDWVALQPNGDSAALIHAILPRTTIFTRKVPGEATEAQIVAANLDTVFIVTDLERDFNLRRIERYLTLVYESGASPVIVLNKADRCARVDDLVSEAGAVAAGAPIVPVSALTGAGFDDLGGLTGRGHTVALIGSSGVGKSTIVNRLLGEDRLKTSAIREVDGRGRHTTTTRQLLLLPSGGVVIDTPGMRELQLWGTEEGLAAAFDDIEALAVNCRFSDCAHEGEPGCGVQAALDDGSLAPERFEGYLKMRRELRFLERKQNVRAMLDERARWKRIHKSAREHMRRKYGD